MDGPENRALVRSIDPSRLPGHVAVIMDGNGRWARHRTLDRVEGHRRGVDSVRMIVTESRKLGIGCLSLYSFSTENWNRPRTEVAALMGLLRVYLIGERGELMDNDIRLVASGDIGRLPVRVRSALERTIALTAGNRSMVLNLCLSYGGRQELVRAVGLIAAEVLEGRLVPGRIDETAVASRLYTAGLPDPDLLIRTSGELRISNFMLWQLAYAEIYVTDTLWPDFSRDEYLKALSDYARRERRFGRTSDQLTTGRDR